MNPPVPPPLGAPYSPAQPTEPLATASLVCGILSWVCLGPLAGIPAIICGHIARGRIERSAGALGGAGLALAGLILGYLSTLALIAFFVIFIVFGAAAAMTSMPFMKTAMSAGMTPVNAMQIAQGVTAYQTQYGHLPLITAPMTEDTRVDSKTLLDVLKGRDPVANPQNTIFFQTLPGLSNDDPAIDGWGQPFNVALDATGDGTVKLGELNVPGAVAVWSSGPNKLDENGKGDDLPSWR